jgi:hypothetical protein|tara:strand:+ start:5235 stop:6446 length:1212 start_codon:yes stop_codon:yes gene_type:complete
MATFKTISSADIKTTRSTLNQLIDFVEEDVSGSLTRKKFKVFVTGTNLAGDPGVTSSIFQTTFDQDYTLQTSNELFDITMGLFKSSDAVTIASSGTDINGKLLFPSTSLMMREKVSVYNQFSQELLGDNSLQFAAPFGDTNSTNKIDTALFLNFKRLFVRDGIKRETFAMRMYRSASSATSAEDGAVGTSGQQNIFHSSISGSIILTDVGAASSIERSNFGGDVGNIVNSSNTSETLGLIFYQKGIVVLDVGKICSGSQLMSGTIGAVGNTAGNVSISQKLIPGYVTSASLDDCIDHFAISRFGSGSQTFLTFQNNTQINSTLIFCRATADEFNFSSNPTYTDSEGRIVVIDESQQGIQKAFSFITTVGLYDANEQLLAVSKLSRPVEKNDEKDLTMRVRLDF